MPKATTELFLDNRGFPDQSNKFNQLLHNIDGGPVLRKPWHPMADLDGLIDLCFHSPFIPKQHEDLMKKQIDLSHLEPNFWEQVYNLICKYWSVFDKRGVFVPVKYYKYVINTGTARPIAVKKILYGTQETIIMQRCISALAKVGHIRQITDGSWLFKVLLA